MRTTVAIAYAAVLSIACSETSGPERGVRGTYSLLTVNGAALPANVTVKGVALRVHSGSLVLSENYAFTMTTTFSRAGDSQSPPMTAICGGSWDSVLTYVLMLFQRASEGCEVQTLDASWDGGRTVTLESESVHFVYKE